MSESQMSPAISPRLPWTGWDDRSRYVDFRGHRYTAPWRCLCCAASVDLKQFLFGRMCPYCDLGRCNLGLAADLSIVYEAGHGVSDVILAAPAIDTTAWCGSRSCIAHLANLPKWLSGTAIQTSSCSEFEIHEDHCEILRRCRLIQDHAGDCVFGAWR